MKALEQANRPQASCRASRAILEEGREIVFMYRVRPTPESKSGWHFFCDGEIELLMEEPDYALACPLQDIRGRDRDAAALLEMPWPVAFARHSLTGQFVNCDDIRPDKVAGVIGVGALILCLLYGIASALLEWPPYAWIAGAQLWLFGGQSAVLAWVLTLVLIMLVYVAGLVLVWIPVDKALGRRGSPRAAWVNDMRELTLDAEELRGDEPPPRYVSNRVLEAAVAAGVILVLGLAQCAYGLLVLSRGGEPSRAWTYIGLGSLCLPVSLCVGVYAWLRNRSEARRARSQSRDV